MYSPIFNERDFVRVWADSDGNLVHRPADPTDAGQADPELY